MSGNGAPKGGGGGGTAEGEYTTAKTSVWWDIENCAVPRGSDPHHIAQNISSALASLGYKGPVSITSFGDTSLIPEPVQKGLHSTGISLNHVPAGVKDASDKKILADMLFWAIDNPPPANYLLISGDRDFSYVLHQLRMRRYNVLLARQPNVSQALEAAAMSVWQWKDLVVGLPPISGPSCTNSIANDGISNTELYGASDASSAQYSDLTTFGYKTNQKISANGKDDSQNKRQVRKLPNQNQLTSSAPRFSADEFKQPSNGNQGMTTNSNFTLVEQTNQVPMRSCTVSQDSTSVNYKGNKGASFTPQSSPQKPRNEGVNSNGSRTKNLREAPHEFFKVKPNTSARPLSGQIRPFSIKSDNNSTYSKKPPHPQPLNPSDLLSSSHSSNAPGNLSLNQNNNTYPTPIRPCGPPFTSKKTWPHGLPFPPIPPGRSTISDYPISGHQTPSYIPEASNPMNFLPGNTNVPQAAQITSHDYVQRPPAPTAMDNSMTNGQWGAPGCLAPHNEAEHLIRNIMSALDILKADKIAPTEANIADCIHYGDINIKNFNIKAALDCAIWHQVVVMHKLGDNLPFYIGKHDKLWKCVNVVDSYAKHPTAIWDTVYNFLCSPAGRSSIMTSQCRYHAATILRKFCLKHLVLGDILQILHVIINIKKWIIPQFHGWQPLSFNVQTSDKDF